MKKIYAEGHRGCAALYPENTLLSYEKAIEINDTLYNCIKDAKYDTSFANPSYAVKILGEEIRRQIWTKYNRRKWTRTTRTRTRPAWRN